MKQVFRAALACAATMGVAACSGGSGDSVLPTISAPTANVQTSAQAPIAASPITLTFTAVGPSSAQTFVASVRGDGALTASSSNSQVATVSPGTAQATAQSGGTKSATFTVTPAGAGTCTVTVANKKGDTTTVNVTVTLPVATTVLHQYVIPGSDVSNGVANGPNGSVWFTQWSGDSVGSLTASGVESNATLDVSPFSSSKPYGLAYGPDGNFWVADFANRRIVQMNASGAILNSYATPYAPTHIASGPDGNLWFTEEDTSGATGFSEVVKLATSGTMTHYPTSASAQTARRFAYDIVSGPDGRLWFTEGNVIGAITTAGAMTEYFIASGKQSEYLVAGGDGNLWFTEPSADRIGRMSTAGVSTDFSVPTQFATPWQIAAGKDGAVWFTENGGGQIGRAAPDGTVTEYAVPNLSGQSAILAGQDGNLWVTSYLGKMIVISY